MLDKIKDIVNPETINDFSKQIELSTLENLQTYMTDASLINKTLTILYILDNFIDSNLTSLLRNDKDLFELISLINKKIIKSRRRTIYNVTDNEIELQYNKLLFEV